MKKQNLKNQKTKKKPRRKEEEKNENRLIIVTLHKAQVYADQGPQHKTIYTEGKVRMSIELIAQEEIS